MLPSGLWLSSPSLTRRLTGAMWRFRVVFRIYVADVLHLCIIIRYTLASGNLVPTLATKVILLAYRCWRFAFVVYQLASGGFEALIFFVRLGECSAAYVLLRVGFGFIVYCRRDWWLMRAMEGLWKGEARIELVWGWYGNDMRAFFGRGYKVYKDGGVSSLPFICSSLVPGLNWRFYINNDTHPLL